ncbi:unnamed protein product [Mycena citricolor]|uniref:Uncharacterized protein n=1 Tax=Mycena citricolor TaxID=2018698 RepID=A0AAD2K094_9AGAR|nr:unnamed protein product [Mycena citricolor]
MDVGDRGGGGGDAGVSSVGLIQWLLPELIYTDYVLGKGKDALSLCGCGPICNTAVRFGLIESIWGCAVSNFPPGKCGKHNADIPPLDTWETSRREA